MVDPKESQFGRAALRSGLLDEKALDRCLEGIPEDRRTPDAIDRRLARQAINAGLLSIWQAQQMLSGRTLGFKVDKYVLLDMLGQGGMGRVYLAKDTRLGRNVALKVLSRERMSNPRAIARFQREAKVGAQLQHENLVRVYDEGLAQGIRYLVMEYIEGDNLGRMIAEHGPIPWPLAARIVRGIALGLDHAFKKNLVHRDVNPFNILVTHDGIAKLTDLGLAFDLADEGNVTRDGATVGTFDYVSPEQARNSHAVDTRSDIYSLGCTFYHMLTGHVPFPMPSLPEKLYGHQMLEPEPVRDQVPNLPEGLVAVLGKMMRKQPEDRYQTPREVADALEPYADAESAQADSDQMADRSNEPGQISDNGLLPPPPSIPNLPRRRRSPGSTDTNISSLSLDFGPEPGLTEGLTVSGRGKARTRSQSQSTSDDGSGEDPKQLRKRKRLVAAGVIGILAVLGTVMGLALSGQLSKDKNTKKTATSSGSNVATTHEATPPTTAKNTDTARNKPKGQSRPTNASPNISVLFPDGGSATCTDLASAVNQAIGSRGTVVLGDRSPISISTSQTVRVQRGSLTIRAAEGTSPTLAIDDAGGHPALESAGGATINLRGLKIVARYPKKSASTPAPLIVSSGPLHIDHCILQARGEVTGSTVLRSTGANVSVQNTLIDGFDRGIDVLMPPGVEVSMRESIFIRPFLNEQPLGWAFHLQNQPVGIGPNRDKHRKIVLDHCSIKGEGAFHLVDFKQGSTIAVEVRNSAIQAKSLIAWTSTSTGQHTLEPNSLKWSGTKNRYDITGDAWIVLSPLASLAAPGSPTDIATWTKTYPEVETRELAFSFHVNPQQLGPDSVLDPANFALQGEGIPTDLGANPDLVGPMSAR